MTAGTWWLIRWHIARWMIHTGLTIAPPGRTKDGLVATLWLWGEHVREVVSTRTDQ